MASFFSILFTIIAILAVLAGGIGAILNAKDGEPGLPILILVLGGLLFLTTGVSIVGTRNTAVEICLGKPVDTLSNGPHLIRPWCTTESYDGSLQTLELHGTEEKGDGPGVSVRLANGAMARVDLNVQWEISSNVDITQIHLDYKAFENIQPNVVELRTRSAVATVFGTYDPVATLQGTSKPVDLAELSKQVKDELTKLLPSQLLVRSITLTPPVFDKVTEENIQKLGQAKTDTQIATQQLITADLRKQANSKLAEANNTPGVLVQNCLDMTERLAQQGKSISMAWTCMGSSNPLGLAITGQK